VIEEVITEAPKVSEAPKVVTVVTEAPKVVEASKVVEVSSSNAAPVTEDKPKKKKEPKADGEDKPKKKKEPKADGEDKPKKKADDKPPAEQPKYVKIQVDGIDYWRITKTNEVYSCEDDGTFGEEVGTYNPTAGKIEFA
jgi:hypothetical protein